MNSISRYFTLLIIAGAISTQVSAQKAADTTWTPKTAKKWVTGRSWIKGSSIKAHSSINDVEFARQYQKNKDAWDKAFAFLTNARLDTMAAGKYTIDGTNVYATITDAPSKEFDQSAWESHRNYIDLQYVISGREKIGVAPVASATVIKPYDGSKDVANYNAEGKYYDASPGEFFLFFPGDAHRPNIKAKGYETVKVKKLVIKIKYIN